MPIQSTYLVYIVVVVSIGFGENCPVQQLVPFKWGWMLVQVACFFCFFLILFTDATIEKRSGSSD